MSFNPCFLFTTYLFHPRISKNSASFICINFIFLPIKNNLMLKNLKQMCWMNNIVSALLLISRVSNRTSNEGINLHKIIIFNAPHCIYNINMLRKSLIILRKQTSTKIDCSHLKPQILHRLLHLQETLKVPSHPIHWIRHLQAFSPNFIDFPLILSKHRGSASKCIIVGLSSKRTTHTAPY